MSWHPKLNCPALKDMFPNASASTVAANPTLVAEFHKERSKNDSTGILKPRRGIMNKVEQEFSWMLEARARKGDIARYLFEGITLRFAGVRYTPDFIVIHENPFRMVLVEVKGNFIKESLSEQLNGFDTPRLTGLSLALKCTKRLKVVGSVSFRPTARLPRP